MKAKVKELLFNLSSKDILIVGETLWDSHEKGWTIGGEQRLIRAFANLVLSRGLRVCVVQPHPVWKYWEGEGILWFGVPPGKRSGWRRWMWNYTLHKCVNPLAKVVYSYAELAYPSRVSNGLIWQHGVGWDGRSPERQWRSRRQNSSVLMDCAAVVCVDTNFPNVMAAHMRSLEPLHKICHYIPNFVDLFPKEGINPVDTPPRVLYVRRFSPGRGTDLMVDVAKTLWSEGVDFTLEMVGYSSHGLEEKYIKQQLHSQLESGRAVLHKLPFDCVCEAYERSHIAVIPTRRGEGTSLACLEAFAFGLPVVATWVGGLPNLVQDYYNGLLVAPRFEDIKEGVRLLINDASLRQRLGANAKESAVRFSKKRWEGQVVALLREVGWIS